jgi:hypothetical protein
LLVQIDLKRSLPHPKKTRKIFVGGLGADVDDGAPAALRHPLHCHMLACICHLMMTSADADS